VRPNKAIGKLLYGPVTLASAFLQSLQIDQMDVPPRALPLDILVDIPGPRAKMHGLVFATWQTHRVSKPILTFGRTAVRPSPSTGKPILHMDELTARLASLLARYAAARDLDKGDGSRLSEQLRNELQLLTAEYGPTAVDAALDRLSD
jgi:hypothetical protein